MPKLKGRNFGNLNLNNPYSMTEDKLRERSTKIQSGRYSGQLFAGLTVSLGSLCFGLVLGWSAPEILIRLAKISQEKAEEYSTIANLAPLGCCFGNIVVATLSNKQGPRKILLILTPIQCVIWLLLTIKVETLQFVLIFFCGFLSISFMVCGETLLQDSVHNSNLYHLYVMFKSSTALGILISYAFGISSIDGNYHSTVSAFLVFLLFILLYFCKESPVFLYEKHPLKAELSLKFYRGETNTYVALRQIKNDSEARTIDESAKYMLFKKAVYKAILIIIGLYFFIAFTSYQAFIAYGTCIFYLANPFTIEKSEMVELQNAFMLGIGMYLASIVGLAFSYRVPYGVKKLLIISTSSATISLLLLAIYFTILERKMPMANYLNYPIIYSMLVNLLAFSHEIAMSSYPDIILYDYLPHQVFLWVKVFVNSFKWAIISIMIKCTFSAQMVFYMHGTLYLIAAISFCGIFYCVFCVIESKDRTLLSIQMQMGGNPVGSRSVFKSRRRQENINYFVETDLRRTSEA